MAASDECGSSTAGRSPLYVDVEVAIASSRSSARNHRNLKNIRAAQLSNTEAKGLTSVDAPHSEFPNPGGNLVFGTRLGQVDRESTCAQVYHGVYVALFFFLVPLTICTAVWVWEKPVGDDQGAWWALFVGFCVSSYMASLSKISDVSDRRNLVLPA